MVEEYLKTHHQTYLTGKGDWKIFSLTRGKYRYKQNCGLCPETTKIIDSLPICWDGGGNIFFSVIQPGTHLNPHCGHTNTRIRYHLGIETSGSGKIRVGTESRTWQNGKCFVFDDSFIHEVYHNSSDRRVVLIVDCWHPDLTEAEKIFLLNMFMRLRTFED